MSSFRGTVNVTRPPAGSYVDGRFQTTGTGTNFQILASVQPATPKDLLALEENRRHRAAFRLYSDTPLQTVEPDSGRNPDIVHLADGDYEVTSVGRWQNKVIDHYKMVVVKMDG